MRLEQEIEAP
jgi:hypothetical protein